MKKIMVINGPNLNLLGVREPDIYGSLTLDDINQEIRTKAINMGIQTDFYQSNCEGEIIGFIHKAMGDYHGIIINAGAYTHYSYAIYDAIKAVKVPTVEVHMSDVNTREEFRKISVIKDACIKTISGFGKDSYLFALDELEKTFVNG